MGTESDTRAARQGRGTNRRLALAAVGILLFLRPGLLRAEAKDPAGPDAGLRIVFFGDSITGADPQKEYRGGYLKFCDLVGLMVEAKTGRPVTVLNRGQAGDNTRKARARLQRDVLDAEPDVAVVLLGAFDKPEDETRDNLTAMLSAMKEQGIRVLVLTYHAARADKAQDYRGFERAAARNPLLAEVAESLSLPVCPLEPAMARAEETRDRSLLVDGHDGMHLRPAGEMAVARAVFARLDALGWLDGR